MDVVLCGVDVEISLSVNKSFKTRCALVIYTTTAKYAKEKLNANVIAIGGVIVGRYPGFEIIDTFIDKKYDKNGENDKFIEKLMSIEDQYQDKQTGDEKNLMNF